MTYKREESEGMLHQGDARPRPVQLGTAQRPMPERHLYQEETASSRFQQRLGGALETAEEHGRSQMEVISRKLRRAAERAKKLADAARAAEEWRVAEEGGRKSSCADMVKLWRRRLHTALRCRQQ